MRKRVNDHDRMSAAFALLSLARHQKIGAATVRSRFSGLAADTEEKIIRFHLAALGEVGDRTDQPLLATYLQSSEPECAIAAAGAILRIEKKP